MDTNTGTFGDRVFKVGDKVRKVGGRIDLVGDKVCLVIGTLNIGTNQFIVLEGYPNEKFLSLLFEKVI